VESSWVARKAKNSSLSQVIQRDAKDSTVVNFTQAADGVVTLDSSDLNFEETVETALAIVSKVIYGD
jgi:cytidylate kinase